MDQLQLTRRGNGNRWVGIFNNTLFEPFIDFRGRLCLEVDMKKSSGVWDKLPLTDNFNKDNFVRVFHNTNGISAYNNLIEYVKEHFNLELIFSIDNDLK